MAITNYSELVEAVKDFINDTDANQRAGDFVLLAETEIKADLELVETQTTATATMSTSSYKLALPTYFVSPIRLHVNYNGEQYPVEFTTADDVLAKRTSTQHRPMFVAVIDGQLEFDCIPDQAYEVEFLHNRLASLNSTTTTNEVFPEFLNCYLYGALKHAAIFLREDDLVGKYAGEYSAIVEKLKASAKRKKFATLLYSKSRYVR